MFSNYPVCILYWHYEESASTEGLIGSAGISARCTEVLICFRNYESQNKMNLLFHF